MRGALPDGLNFSEGDMTACLGHGMFCTDESLGLLCVPAVGLDRA